ncbi:MAG: hypothetical protein J6L86_04525 [Alphaproteobacteria bacterium]|nr:hypothetical protein [Alphaproteobacteria bacterium]
MKKRVIDKINEINEYGRRYGYPVYVFIDGTLGSALGGKTVYFIVEGPLDLSQENLQLLSSEKSFPELKRENRLGFFGKVKNIWPFCQNDDEPQYVEFEEIQEPKVLGKRCPEKVAPDTQVSQLNKEMTLMRDKADGILAIRGKNWSAVAKNVSSVETDYVRHENADGSVEEVFSARFTF